jgi:hypothetical protein
MRLRSVFTVFVALLATRPHVRAAAPANASQAQSPVVDIVELFTSEGCSSCPPADALLQQINLKQTSAGQLIVGLSEHVTYRNHLGWKDPYSEQTFTDSAGRLCIKIFSGRSIHTADGAERSRAVCRE